MRPVCSKHNLPMTNSLWYGWICTKCRDELKKKINSFKPFHSDILDQDFNDPLMLDEFNP